MFSEDFRKVEDQTSRAKSITMIKYNDVKQRQKLDKIILKKQEKAEKNVKIHFKDKVDKVKKALEKFEMIQQRNAKEKQREKWETKEKLKKIHEKDKKEKERIDSILAHKQSILEEYKA